MMLVLRSQWFAGFIVLMVMQLWELWSLGLEFCIYISFEI